jgi:small-conductance mechanosensitive channel
MEDNISELISVADDIEEEVSRLQQQQFDDLFVARNPKLWNVKLSSSEIFPMRPRLRKAWHENAKTVNIFLNDINYFYLIFIVAIVVLLFLFIIKNFRKLDLTESDPNFVIVKRILLEHPYSAVAFILLTLFIVLLTNMPLIINGIVGTALLFFALKFLPKVIGPKGKVIVRVVLTLYILNLFEIVFWYFGNFAQLYITAESIIAMVLIFRYGMESSVKIRKNAPPFVKIFRIISMVFLILFTVAFFSILFGYEVLAVLLLKIGVKTAAIMIIVFSAHVVLRSIILAAVEIGRNSKLRVKDKRWELIEKRAIQVLNILAFVILIKFVLQNMEIYRSGMDWLTGFLEYDWGIGTLNISIGSLLDITLILAITFGLTRFVRAVIEDEFLDRTNLPKGVPAAISITIQYFIVTLGVFMTLSVAGLDLSKFGLLAGALGVGIGFGLQNIVNNFISGLILVYGRPVNVGDTIEVENLLGKVKRIGVRSSNVRTFDGAEVVVPNGNLISNQLINWTLSDNKRRVELKIGAAYGSNPNVVLDLLKKVAMGHEEVLKEPEPRALFEEFGDSSLNFRLLFWVPFEKGIGTKSDIAIGVYNIFAENNIQIPFPQMDLHVKKDDELPEK